MNLNKAELIGNLVADPVAKALPSGQTVASFSVATQHVWNDRKTKKQKNDVEYHPVVAWGKLGDVVAKYLKKGDKVYVDGRLKTTSTQENGKFRRYRTEVIASNLIMLGGGKKESAEKTNDEVVVEEIDIPQE